MAKTLELRFGTSAGSTRSLNVQDPVLNLEAAEAEEAMNTIIGLNLFTIEGTNPYATIRGARYVERVVEDIFEVE